MAFQALYRRYRPQRFGEVRGQEHVVSALRNAVRDGAVAHAYLFSGPRGTGKTSTARILAKALNCEDLHDGEPCGVCEPCRAVEAGTSMAVTELDAASNNGVEAIRDLIQRASLGTSGRTKVYIVDEVHMLSTPASNALLKTLEEPPGHVVFVLATTDPHKVLPTIRSRTQHYDFHLLPAALLGDHLRAVAADAGLDVGDVAIDRAVRRGDGSARDALSALDQIVAAGGDGDDDASVDEIVEGLCERDTARALGGVALACGTGADPRSVATAVAAHLRDALLSLMAPDLVSLPDATRAVVADQARRLGPGALVRALDAIGDAVLALPNAPDPRVTLEVALVKVTRPDVDASAAALLERIERLERAAVGAPSPLEVLGAVADRGQAEEPPPAPPAAASRPALGSVLRPERSSPAAPSPPPAPPAGAPARTPSTGGPARAAGAPAAAPSPGKASTAAAPSPPTAPPAGAPARTPSEGDPARAGGRPAPAPSPAGTASASAPPTGAGGSSAAGTPSPAGRSPRGDEPPRRPGPSPAAPSPAAGATGPTADLPDRAALSSAWTDVVGRLSNVARSRFSTGRFQDVADGAAVLALPSAIMRDLCDERRPELEGALEAHFGRPIPVRLVVDAGTADAEPAVGSPPDGDEPVDLEELVDAPNDRRLGIARLTEAFPGAEVVDGGDAR